MINNGFFRLGILFLLVFAVSGAESLGAAGAVVTRDGALMFQEPSNDSAVLDILSRGTEIDVLEEVGQWCKASVPGSSRQGYIRAENISMGEQAREDVPDAAPRGSEMYRELENRLEQTEDKMSRASRALMHLQATLDRLEQGPSPAKGKVAGNAAEAAGAGMAHSATGPGFMDLYSCSWGLGAFGAYMSEGETYNAGMSALMNPSWLGRGSLECEAMFSAENKWDDMVSVSFGVLWPAGIATGRLTTYVAAGGGMVRRRVALDSHETNPSLSMGGGLSANIRSGWKLRFDARSVVEFAESSEEVGGRFYLGLAWLR